MIPAYMGCTPITLCNVRTEYTYGASVYRTCTVHRTETSAVAICAIPAPQRRNVTIITHT